MKVKIGKYYVAKELPQIVVKAVDIQPWEGTLWVKVQDANGESEIRMDLFQNRFISKKQYYKSHLERKDLILGWAEQKQLLKPENAIMQLAKLTEEVGELANAIIKNNKKGKKDALGDIRVVITILANQLGEDIDDCEEFAWQEIKNRTGKTVNGSFIKD